MATGAVQYWLFKSEPSTWSWEMQMAAGSKGTSWDGVRNHTAKQNLMAMRPDDKGFFYHSNEGKEIVGIVEVIRSYFPDPAAKEGESWVAVQLKAVQPLKKTVTLSAIKAEPQLSGMALVKYSRLSVQPVTEAEWKLICKYGDVPG